VASVGDPVPGGVVSDPAERPSAGAAALADATGLALTRPAGWFQLAKFCAVGASGYAVNLAVYTALVLSDVHYAAAAVCSFLVAVTNNYTWNRLWTFRTQRGHLVFQGFRFFVVSVVGLGANLVFLTALVMLGVPKIPAQATAIVLVTPWSFVANKLWSFHSGR
jgi:putative flippase GtrA